MWLVLLYPEPKRETHSELRNTTGRLGFDKTRLSQARSRLLARAGARGANLFLNLILDRHAQRVVVLEPAIGSQLIRKHLEVVGIADLFAGVNVDQNFHLGLVISWRPVLTGQSAPVLLRHANDLLFRASGPGQVADRCARCEKVPVLPRPSFHLIRHFAPTLRYELIGDGDRPNFGCLNSMMC